MSRQAVRILGVLATAAGALWATHQAQATQGGHPSVCVTVQEGCYVPGSMVHVTLDMGQGEPVIVAGKLTIGYDPDVLEFAAISPGSTCDPSSPFVAELHKEVDEDLGEISYQVVVSPAGGPGTSGPATLACLDFVALDDEATEICIFTDPMLSFLAEQGGIVPLPIDNSEDCPEDPLESVSCEDVAWASSCTCPSGAPDCSAWDDACNLGECIPAPPRCEPVPANEGGPCDDGNPCTTTDFCMEGVCVGTGCTNQSVCVVADEGCLAFEGAQLRLVMGAGDPVIVGGEFWIEYDPQVLEFIDASPGATCDPDSPFVIEIYKSDNDGIICYAVGVGFVQGSGTQGPATLACLNFSFTDDWQSEVCLLAAERTSSPTQLVDENGQGVEIYNGLDCPPGPIAPEYVLSCDNVLMDVYCLCEAGTPDCSALNTDCIEGVCNEDTGRCRKVVVNEGGPCDDGNPCTLDDRCIAGRCIGSGCTDPSLCIVEESCLIPGHVSEIQIRLGQSEYEIMGGQFTVWWDPTDLELLDIAPGSACDPGSPFSLPLFEIVDAEAGKAFYAVSVYPGMDGTTGPAAMACLTFAALTADPDEVCLIYGFNPFNTILLGRDGTTVGIYNGEDCPLYDYPESFLACTDVCTIPAVSEWGLVVLTLLLLVAAKVRFSTIERGRT